MKILYVFFENILLEDVKGLACAAEEQIKITLSSAPHVFDLDEVAEDLDFERIKPHLDELLKNGSVNQLIYQTFKEIDEIFASVSYGAKDYDAVFWTDEGVRNDSLWEELRKKARVILNEQSKIR